MRRSHIGHHQGQLHWRREERHTQASKLSFLANSIWRTAAGRPKNHLPQHQHPNTHLMPSTPMRTVAERL